MGWHTAIMGATGAVGTEFLRLLEERDFPLASLKLLASHRSAGKKLAFRGEQLVIEELCEQSFEGVELVLASAGGEISKRFAPAAIAAGAVIVDNTSAFRMDENVPLVVPEVNAADIAGHQGIIANPNCSTIVMTVPVWPLHQAHPIRRIVMSTYQAVSGAGARAMAELRAATRAYLDGEPFTPAELPMPSAFNVWSHGSEIGDDGYNTEERKTWRETRKIFHCEDILITATCVRVPVLRAHTESINIEFHEPVDENEAREILAAAPGVKVVDDRERNYFPMPIDASGQDNVLVGRIRRDVSLPDGRGLHLLVAGDQIRKGAALNALQIAERL